MEIQGTTEVLASLLLHVALRIKRGSPPTMKILAEEAVNRLQQSLAAKDKKSTSPALELLGRHVLKHWEVILSGVESNGNNESRRGRSRKRVTIVTPEESELSTLAVKLKEIPVEIAVPELAANDTTDWTQPRRRRRNRGRSKTPAAGPRPRDLFFIGKCWNCEEYGHGQRSCPKPRRTDTVFFNCGRKGFITLNCVCRNWWQGAVRGYTVSRLY